MHKLHSWTLGIVTTNTVQRLSLPICKNFQKKIRQVSACLPCGSLQENHFRSRLEQTFSLRTLSWWFLSHACMQQLDRKILQESMYRGILSALAPSVRSSLVQELVCQSKEEELQLKSILRLCVIQYGNLASQILLDSRCAAAGYRSRRPSH